MIIKILGLFLLLSLPFFFISLIMGIFYNYKKKRLIKSIGDNYSDNEEYKVLNKKHKKAGIICGISIALFSVGLIASSIDMKEQEKIKAEKQAMLQLEQKEKENVERVNNLAGEDKVFFEEKYSTYIKTMSEKDARDKALKNLDDKIKAQKEEQARIERMHTTFNSGWNTKTTDTDSDNTNFQKALDLLKTYEYEINEMEAVNVNINDVMKKPWEYYGKVVNVGGIVYNIRSRPPGDSIVDYMGKACFEATMRCNEETELAIYIMGDSSNYQNKRYASFKGFICGHAILVNTKFGGQSKGLLFVGVP